MYTLSQNNAYNSKTLDFYQYTMGIESFSSNCFRAMCCLLLIKRHSTYRKDANVHFFSPQAHLPLLFSASCITVMESIKCNKKKVYFN